MSSDFAGGDLAAQELRELRALVVELRHERDMLADDVQVKTQMAVSLANAYHAAAKALSEAKAASSNKDEQLITNVSEVSSMKAQLQQQTTKAAAAERRCRDLEAEVQEARHAAADAEHRAASAAALENDVKRLNAEREEKAAEMEQWRANVKEALKQNRKKEQQHVQTEIESQRTITRLQEQVNKLSFDLETAAVRDSKRRATADATTQTVKTAATPPLSPAMPPMRPGTPQSGATADPSPLPPGLMNREASHAFFSPGTPQHGTAASEGFAAPWASPPAIKPEEDKEPPPPIIVTVHYGSSDGWTVDTKLVVKPGMTVADVIAEACEKVNRRYERNLDCAGMCLKTHHVKAKRFVVLSEHREMHSFTYFRKCQAEAKPVILQLEAIPANALFASPTGRLSGRPSASLQRPPRPSI